MKKNLLYIIAVLSVLVSCTEEKMELGTPLTGQDVKFSVSMGNNARTVYGEEATDGKSIKVNWVNGDKITVFGTTCSVQQADYSVVANTANQNYADDLVKTGAAGVQWGSEPSDFYAIYPAVDEAIEIDEQGIVTINTSVRQYQNNDFVYNESTNTWVGTPYVEGSTTNTMPDALMYAYTGGVKSTDNNGVVDLKFKPFSTVLKFTLDGWNVHNDMTNQVGSDAVAYVSKITVKAPEAVTGDCVFTMVGSDISVEGGNSEDIIIYPKSLPLKQGQKLEFSAFAIPNTYMMSSGDKSWIVEIETTNFGTHTYHIQPTVPQELVAGAIHKVKIPAIEVNRGEVTLPAANWIRWIPRNVYLSELSLPGAWYATDGNYQNTTNLTTQYDNGIRAFHIDCRLSPSSFKPSLFGSDEYGALRLVCSGTDKWDAAPELGSSIYNPFVAGTAVVDALKTIASKVTNTEYVVVVLTIAEKPLSSSGNVYGGATVDPSKVLPEIYKMLSDNASALKLYTQPINSETKISDVLNHMIVKVNVNTNSGKFIGYGNGYALVSEGSMVSDNDYVSGDIIKGVFTKMNTVDMYWGNTKSDLKYYYHQAQLTTSSTDETDGNGTPSIGDRKKAISDIINKSDAIYSENTHNGWFQIGLGGYYKSGNSEDHESVAKALNPHLLTLINNKLEESPSPVGIVLMNYCTSTSTEIKSAELVKAILSMNTKFYLNRELGKPEWPDGNPYLEEGKDNGDF